MSGGLFNYLMGTFITNMLIGGALVGWGIHRSDDGKANLLTRTGGGVFASGVLAFLAAMWVEIL